MATTGPITVPVPGVDEYVLQTGGATIGTFKQLKAAGSAIVNVGAVLQGHAPKQACVVNLAAGTGSVALDQWRRRAVADPATARQDFTLLARAGGHVQVAWQGASGLPVALRKTTTGISLSLHCKSLEATFS
jgi:hypothetical protein